MGDLNYVIGSNWRGIVVVSVAILCGALFIREVYAWIIPLCCAIAALLGSSLWELLSFAQQIRSNDKGGIADVFDFNISPEWGSAVMMLGIALMAYAAGSAIIKAPADEGGNTSYARKLLLRIADPGLWKRLEPSSRQWAFLAAGLALLIVVTSLYPELYRVAAKFSERSQRGSVAPAERNLSSRAINSVERGQSEGLIANTEVKQFSYIAGLDPKGDNWLALRSEPAIDRGVRLMQMGPDTLFTVLRHEGDWTQIKLSSGETGWAYSRFIVTQQNPMQTVPTQFRGEWYANFSQCGTGLDDSALTINARAISFYESGGPILAVITRGRTLTIIAQLKSGEDGFTTWDSTREFELSLDQSILTDITNPTAILGRWRCPAKQ